MAEPYRISIKIAGRNYPISVAPKDEEVLRRVGKNIEKMIKEIEANFAVKDKQDALSMCTLRLGMLAENYKLNNEENILNSTKRLENLNSLLETELENL